MDEKLRKGIEEEIGEPVGLALEVKLSPEDDLELQTMNAIRQVMARMRTVVGLECGMSPSARENIYTERRIVRWFHDKYGQATERVEDAM